MLFKIRCFYVLLDRRVKRLVVLGFVTSRAPIDNGPTKRTRKHEQTPRKRPRAERKRSLLCDGVVVCIFNASSSILCHKKRKTSVWYYCQTSFAFISRPLFTSPTSNSFTMQVSAIRISWLFCFIGTGRLEYHGALVNVAARGVSTNTVVLRRRGSFRVETWQIAEC